MYSTSVTGRVVFGDEGDPDDEGAGDVAGRDGLVPGLLEGDGVGVGDEGEEPGGVWGCGDVGVPGGVEG